MDPVVPAEITHELTQILANLVLGDNDIRSNAEKAVNERLAQTPELYLLALAQFAIVADTDVMRSFSLVLLRRLLFRPAHPPSSSTTHQSTPHHHHHPQGRGIQKQALYDHLSGQTITTLERLLLHSLLHEPNAKVRRNAVETTCEVANQGMRRGRPWHGLQSQAFSMAQAQAQIQGEGEEMVLLGRASAYGVFAGATNLILDLHVESVLGVLKRGLEDSQSIDVRAAALRASVAYLESADPHQLAQSTLLLGPMLSTLASLAHALSLAPPSLASSIPNTLPHSTAQSNYHHLSVFLAVLTPLCGSHPLLFAPHLAALLQLLSPLILPAVDCGPTPTVSRPFPSRSLSLSSSAPSPSSSSSSSTPPTPTPPGPASSSFTFPPPSPKLHQDQDILDESEEHDLRQTLRLSALEFMLTLSEAKPGMVKRVAGWVEVVVRACLEAMGEMDEDEEGVEGWLGEDPSSSSSSAETDSPPALYEQSLDRLACALGGRAVLPSAFQYIPSMLLSYDWRVRHAGLMAIAAIGEGTGKVMLEQLGKVVELVTPMFRDVHPRVRYAACQCVGQLCTDLEEVIQEQYHQQLFAVLIPTLEDPEPRVHAHAAAALINFCEGVARDTLVPYLDLIVERLLWLLRDSDEPGSSVSQATSDASASQDTVNGNGNGEDGIETGSRRTTATGRATGSRRYVQEQAITTLAMVADASEGMFVKHYTSIMPLLLNVLRNADGPEYRRLRVKAMECAGLVAIAVGRDVFRPDAAVLVELLIRIQNTPPDPSDTQLGHYLIATWAKVCQAMGPEFEPYLHIVVPSLVQIASAKPDVDVYDSDSDSETPSSHDREGWETLTIDGQTLAIRTSAIEEKCQAFETLVIYCSTLGAHFAPYVIRVLEVTLPALEFYYHEGVREAGALLVPMLLASAASANTPTHTPGGGGGGAITNQIVEASFRCILKCIRNEGDPSFLASLYKCLNDSLRVVGGPSSLPQEYVDGIVDVTKQQLQAIADRRRGRARRVQAQQQGGGAGEWAAAEDKEEMALMEEVEDFVLEDMGKMLGVLDPAHPLLVAVAGVKDLGFNTWEGEEDE